MIFLIVLIHKQQNINRVGSLMFGRESLLFIIKNPFNPLLHPISTMFTQMFTQKRKHNFFKKVWSQRIQTKRKLDTNSVTIVSAQMNTRIKQNCRSTQFDSCRIPLQHNSKFLNLYINQCFKQYFQNVSTLDRILLGLTDKNEFRENWWTPPPLSTFRNKNVNVGQI